MIFICYL